MKAVGVLPGCHPPGQHGGRDPESGVRYFLWITISRDDWLSPEDLVLGGWTPSKHWRLACLNLSLILKYRKSFQLRFIVWTGRESVMLQTGSKPSILAWIGRCVPVVVEAHASNDEVEEAWKAIV